MVEVAKLSMKVSMKLEVKNTLQYHLGVSNV